MENSNNQESSRIGSQTIINRDMIILGTGTNQGEDSASIGRIVMLEIIADKESAKEIQAPTKQNERDERFYAQTKIVKYIIIIKLQISLEDDNMYNIYLNSTNTQREYYYHELSYYKKCMQQDKIEILNIEYIMYLHKRTCSCNSRKLCKWINFSGNWTKIIIISMGWHSINWMCLFRHKNTLS